LSDLEARPAVDLFVGFGGAVKRARIVADADVYIHSAVLSPILPLALGRSLPQNRSALLSNGLQRVAQGEVTFRQPEKQAAFLQAHPP
jgi:hypothetical protein